MPTPVILPRQGNTVESCVIVRWLKPVGTEVRAGEPLVEIETDKAAMEVESPATGVVIELLFPEGANVEVLQPIAWIGALGEKPAPPDASPAPPAGTESPLPLAPSEPKLALPSVPSSQRRLPAISPRAARLASALAVNLDQVTGTGPQGRIIERDVQAALAQRTPGGRTIPAATPALVKAEEPARPLKGEAESATAPNRSAAPDFPGPKREVPLTSTRRVIAERMRQSLDQTAQVTLHAAADISGMVLLRHRLNAERQAAGREKYRVNDFVLLAVSRVLPEFPALNAHGLADRVLEFESAHLGMAVDTPRGLLAPVIRFAERLEFEALATEARRLANACRDGTVHPEELQGGTFTVTNLGSLGIETFTPILNAPEVAILGVGGIQYRPHPDQPAPPVPHLLFSLTFDHRVLDGAAGARFLRRLAEVLAKIDVLLAGPRSESETSQ